ncbi:MAG TPA: gfo/Idh/MocA family oxidoreductase, partial [Ruminococcaceae bacterium]|nr:gfo/Idh/MocA family oxidoreductase [Oscillospiraceae bacterium]
MMINVALVGTWHVHFSGYANAIANNNDCHISVLWDAEEERGKKYADEYKCDFEPNYDKLLARADVDAVMVCSATNLHKELMIKAANAGKHIFTEKVLCFNEKDAFEVAEAVKKSGVKFCISYPWRSRSDFQWVKKALDEKLIGEVNYLRMRNAHNGTVAGWLPQTFYDEKACGGGAMMDLGA